MLVEEAGNEHEHEVVCAAPGLVIGKRHHFYFGNINMAWHDGFVLFCFVLFVCFVCFVCWHATEKGQTIEEEKLS